MKMIRIIFKNLILFLIGGGIYCLIELLFRGRSHYSMIAVGGFCFLLCGWLNKVIPWEIPIITQMFICSVMITVVELAAGYILNVRLGLDIWDYSNMPLNIMGQICLPFTVAWFFLSAVGIVLDDYLRYWMFGEEKPHYVLWRKRCLKS